MIVFGNKDLKDINQSDIQLLVDNNTTESVILEFKKEPTKNSKELAKDVSALANSEGGFLIYGLEENESGQASSINWLNASDKFPERFENIVATTIVPFPDFKITEISNEEDQDKTVYVVFIPQSIKLHMVVKDKDNRYYKRLDRTVQQMEHSEITERIKSQMQQEKDIIELLKALNEDFKQNSGEQVNSIPYITYFVIPDSLNGKCSTEHLKNAIESLGPDRPTRGLVNNGYKNTLVITGYDRNNPTYWKSCTIIHRNGTIEYRRNLDSEYGTSFASTNEARKIAAVLYWATKLFEEINYYGGFKLSSQILNVSDFRFGKTNGNTQGTYSFKGEKIIESVEILHLIESNEEALKKKVLDLMKQIGNYLSINGDGAYQNIKDVLDNNKLATLLNQC